MKIFIIILALIIDSLFLINNCESQWEITSGPNSGFIRCFANDGVNIYTGTYGGGVFLSTNNGDSWVAVNNGLTKQNILSLTICNGNIFAGTESDGIFISTNNGNNWSVSLPSKMILSLASTGNYIFAGSGSIYISTNNGNNWTLSSMPDLGVSAISAIGNNIYAGTQNSGAYISTDYGVNWTQINNGLTNLKVYTFTSIGNNVFAGTMGGGVFVTSNNGANWIAVSNGITYKFIQSLVTSGSIIFAGTWIDGIYMSTNEGVNWSLINNGLTNHVIRTLSIMGINLYAGTEGSGIFLSSNNGSLWNEANTGLTNLTVQSLSKLGTGIFAGTNRGIYISTNNGDYWSLSGLSTYNIYSFATIGTDIFAAADGYQAVVKSTNNGVNWVTTGQTATAYSLAVKGTYLFAGLHNSPFGGVRYTTNSGGNWTDVSNGLYGSYATSMAVIGNYLFAIAQGLYVTSNNGSNWITLTGSPPNAACLSVNGNYLYMGTGNGVYYTTNYGSNWTAAGLTGKSINSLYSDGSNLFAGASSSGVYLSTDNGMNWSEKNQGFVNIPYVMSFLVDNGYVYAGTKNHSVWRRSLSEIIGINNISTEIPAIYSLSQNYPNPFNPTTKIKFDVTKFSNVKIVVYDISGREVKTLVNERLHPGTYETTFNGSNLTSGVYFYRMITDGFSETKKMLLIK